MTSIVALGAVTVGIDVTSSRAELLELGLTPGSYTVPSIEKMEEIRLALESNRSIPFEPSNGGSVGNSANLIARAGVSCGFMGVGGDDGFGRKFVANCENASVEFLSKLEDGAVTGYDFYLYDEQDERTIVWTSGANALLSSDRINDRAIQNAALLLLDGSALSYGANSEAAIEHCIQVAQKANVPFVLTLSSTRIVNSYRAFYDEFAPKAQMVAGNLEQTAVLVGLDSDAPLQEVKAALAQTRIDAIVTLDADGVFARLGEDEAFMPTQAAEAVDSTGAGDAFLGAFLVARINGHAVEQALAVGNSIAGEVIQYNGAQLPANINVAELMQEAMKLASSNNG